MKEIKPKNCGACTREFKPFKTTDQACCTTCAVALAGKKARKKARKSEDKADLERKNLFKLNDTTHQHFLTQKVFNRMRVLEEMECFKIQGIEPYCISCQRTNMDWCCGHYKTVGSSGHLRYDRKNTYLQCNKNCNMSLSGNMGGNATSIGYTKGLSYRFGLAAGSINQHCNVNVVKKWTGKELSDLRKCFNKQIRFLESK